MLIRSEVTYLDILKKESFNSRTDLDTWEEYLRLQPVLSFSNTKTIIKSILQDSDTIDYNMYNKIVSPHTVGISNRLITDKSIYGDNTLEISFYKTTVTAIKSMILHSIITQEYRLKDTKYFSLFTELKHDFSDNNELEVELDSILDLLKMTLNNLDRSMSIFELINILNNNSFKNIIKRLSDILSTLIYDKSSRSFVTKPGFYNVNEILSLLDKYPGVRYMVKSITYNIFLADKASDIYNVHSTSASGDIVHLFNFREINYNGSIFSDNLYKPLNYNYAISALYSITRGNDNLNNIDSKLSMISNKLTLMSDYNTVCYSKSIYDTLKHSLIMKAMLTDTYYEPEMVISNLIKSLYEEMQNDK